MGPAEDYRAKAAEYERLTRATKSPRESRNYRRQAEMYRALALGEEPDISPRSEGWRPSMSKLRCSDPGVIRVEIFVGPHRGTSLAMSEV
jgi:hypothetical protein